MAVFAACRASGVGLGVIAGGPLGEGEAERAGVALVAEPAGSVEDGAALGRNLVVGDHVRSLSGSLSQR